MNHAAKPWSAEEDATLRDHVQRYGPKKWDYAAQQILGRTDKSCRLRYLNHLDSRVNKSPLTPEEDAMIVKAQQGSMKNKWSKMVKLIGNGRTDNQIKNRWHTFLKKIHERDEGGDQMDGSESQSKRRRSNRQVNPSQQKQHQLQLQQLDQGHPPSEPQHHYHQEQSPKQQDMHQRLVSAAQIAELGGQHEASALLLGLADGVQSGHITQEQRQVLQELQFLAPQALGPSDTAEQNPQPPAASTSGPHQHLQLTPLPTPPPPPSAASAAGCFQRQRPQASALPVLAVGFSQPPQIMPFTQPPQLPAAPVDYRAPIATRLRTPASASSPEATPVQEAPACASTLHTAAHGSQAEQLPAAPGPPAQLPVPKESSASAQEEAAPALTLLAGTTPSLASSFTPAATSAAAAPCLLPLPPSLSNKSQAEAPSASQNSSQLVKSPSPPNQPKAVTHAHSVSQDLDVTYAPTSTLAAYSKDAATTAAGADASGMQDLVVHHDGHLPPSANALTVTAPDASGAQALQGSLPPSAPNRTACTAQNAPGVQPLLVQHQVLQQELLQLGAFVQRAQHQGPMSESLAAQLHNRQQMLELQMEMLRGLITQLLAHPPDQHASHTQQQQQQVCSFGSTMPPSAKHPQPQPLSLASSSSSNAVRTTAQVPGASMSSGSSRSCEKTCRGGGGVGDGGKSTASKRGNKVGGKVRQESNARGKQGALKRAREGGDLAPESKAASTGRTGDVSAGFELQCPQGFEGPQPQPQACPQAQSLTYPPRLQSTGGCDLLHTDDPWYFGQLLAHDQAFKSQYPPSHQNLDKPCAAPLPAPPLLNFLADLNWNHEQLQQQLRPAEQPLSSQALLPPAVPGLQPPPPPSLLQQSQQLLQQRPDEPLLLSPLPPHPEHDVLAGLPRIPVSPSREDLFELAHWAMGPSEGDC